MSRSDQSSPPPLNRQAVNSPRHDGLHRYVAPSVGQRSQPSNCAIKATFSAPLSCTLRASTASDRQNVRQVLQLLKLLTLRSWESCAKDRLVQVVIQSFPVLPAIYLPDMQLIGKLELSASLHCSTRRVWFVKTETFSLHSHIQLRVLRAAKGLGKLGTVSRTRLPTRYP